MDDENMCSPAKLGDEFIWIHPTQGFVFENGNHFRTFNKKQCNFLAYFYFKDLLLYIKAGKSCHVLLF